MQILPQVIRQAEPNLDDAVEYGRWLDSISIPGNEDEPPQLIDLPDPWDQECDPALWPDDTDDFVWEPTADADNLDQRVSTVRRSMILNEVAEFLSMTRV